MPKPLWFVGLLVCWIVGLLVMVCCLMPKPVYTVDMLLCAVMAMMQCMSHGNDAWQWCSAMMHSNAAWQWYNAWGMAMMHDNDAIMQCTGAASTSVAYVHSRCNASCWTISYFGRSACFCKLAWSITRHQPSSDRFNTFFFACVTHCLCVWRTACVVVFVTTATSMLCCCSFWHAIRVTSYSMTRSSCTPKRLWLRGLHRSEAIYCNALICFLCNAQMRHCNDTPICFHCNAQSAASR